MLKSKKIVFFLNLIIALFLSSFIVNSVCITSPSSIEISSGSFNLGTFSPSDTISINPNLNTHPLKIEFIFENNQANCFVDENDFELKLFSTGVAIIADSLSNQNNSGNYVSTFTFLEQINLEVTSSFVSTYTISSAGNSQSSGSILFAPDTSAPLFEIFAYQPTNPLLGGGQEITINYRIRDTGAGLDLITINSGSSNQIITFNSQNSSYEGSIIETLDSTKTYTITARDKLGLSSFETVTFVVDNEAPIITSIDKNYDYDTTRRVSFNTVVEDVSFLYNSIPPTVIGDFSLINPSFSSYLGTCLRLTNSSYSCSFNDIEITAIDSTETIFVIFNSTDSLGNSRVQSFNEEIFVDKVGPEIQEFYLENSIGVENIFSSSDVDVKVHLKFKDESIPNGIPRIFIGFDLVEFPIESCSYTGTTGICSWSLGNLSSIYGGYENRDALFEITVLDYYSNSASDSFSAELDNNFPIITTIEVIETESIKDGIIKSDEVINFRVFIEDENLNHGGQYFVNGDFSQIDFRENYDNVEGLCSSFNTNTIQCDFNSIVVENGYMMRNVTFTISDVAGNTITREKEIEIFQVSNEVFSSYRIKDMEILNPLNRNQMKTGGGVGWFEGTIDLVSGNDVSIVNFELVSCAEEEMDPILVVDYELFPEQVVVNTGQENIENFAMKVELKDHQNLNDLNDNRMTCIMSILKKDAETVYAPEKVEFELLFMYYDIPRGDLLNAHAENILAMYDEIDFLGEWFDTTYDFYSLFDGVCTAIGSGGTSISAFSEAWTIISWALKKFPASGPFTAPIDGQTYSIQEKFSNLFSAEDSKIKIMCDWVTCRNGAHLTGLLSGGYGTGEDEYGFGNIPGLGDAVKGWNNLCSQGGVALFDSKDGVFSNIGGEGE